MIEFAPEETATIAPSQPLNIVEETIPSPCRYCLQPLKVGDDVVFVVWRVITVPELEPIHRGCRP